MDRRSVRNSLLLVVLAVLLTVVAWALPGLFSDDHFFSIPAAYGAVLILIYAGALGVAASLYIWVTLSQPTLLRFTVAFFLMLLILFLIWFRFLHWMGATKWNPVLALTTYLTWIGFLWPWAFWGRLLYGQTEARPVWRALAFTIVLAPLACALPPHLWPPDFRGLGSRLPSIAIVDLLTLFPVAVSVGTPGPAASWLRKAAGVAALCLLSLGLSLYLRLGVLWPPERAALAHFRRVYPELAVQRPRRVVRMGPPGSPPGTFIVYLPTPEWTFMVWVSEGQVTEDGMAEFRAAQVAVEHARQAGLTPGFPRPSDVVEDEPIPGAFHVNLRGHAEGDVEVVVYRGRVVDMRQDDKPHPHAWVLDLINARLDPPRQAREIRWRWEYENGTVAYGFRDSLGDRGYALLQGNRVLRLMTDLFPQEWVPPERPPYAAPTTP